MEDATIRLATGPVTWGVDFADDPGNPPWEVVLDEIAASPLDALELGPIGYLPEAPDQLREALDSRRLRAVGSFVFDDFHDSQELERVLGVARRASRAIAAAGGDVLVIIDRPSSERVATAGRSADAPRLSERRWRELVYAFERVAEIAREEGLRPALHPHAGGWLEFGDELERVVEGTDLDFCLDTGHLAIAGIPPEQALSVYGTRLAHVHLKDVDGAVLGEMRSRGLDFWAAIRAGVFCPLGEGVVEFAAVARSLQEIGYERYATIEQDRVPGSGAPLDDLRRSLAGLAAAGAAVGVDG